MKLKLQDAKVGDYVWWTAERYFKSWDVPGIIVDIFDVGEFKKVKIKTFDDNSETIISEDTFEKEIKLSSKIKAEKYIRSCIAASKKRIVDLENDIENENSSIQNYQSVINSLPNEKRK